MKLGTNLEGCVLVYNGRALYHDVSKYNIGKFKLYHDRVTKDYTGYNVWYDTVERVCFSGAQFVDIRNAGKDQNFYSSKDRFLSNFEHYAAFYKKDREIFKKQQIIVDSEKNYIMSNPDLMKKFNDKKIIIVGGGPSTNDVNWENIDYDCIWTCNEFYKNDKLKNKKIDFVSFAPLCDSELNKPEIEDHFIENKDMIAAFPVDRSGFSTKPVVKFFNKYTDQTCFYHTRYSPAIGSMNRLICLAIFCGAKEVYFVGMDGRSSCEKDGEQLHSFDGKKPLPNWYKNYGDRFQLRQFVIFYDYIMKLKEDYNFQIYNLGEGHRYNVSSPITKKLFPLTRDIKSIIERENEE